MVRDIFILSDFFLFTMEHEKSTCIDCTAVCNKNHQIQHVFEFRMLQLTVDTNEKVRFGSFVSGLTRTEINLNSAKITFGKSIPTSNETFSFVFIFN